MKFLDLKFVSVCGVRGTKGPKQRPSVDPELALQDLPTDDPSRKLNNRGKNPTRRNKPGSKKTKRKNITKANKKRNKSKKKNGLVKREAFSKESNPASLKKGKKKDKSKKHRQNKRRTKGKKKRKRKKTNKKRGNLRQGESGAPDGSDVRTRQVWPWMVGSINCVQYQIKPVNELIFKLFDCSSYSMQI